MKTINYKILLIILISFIFLQSAKAQCVASFTYTDDGNGVITMQSTSDSIYNVWWQVDSNYIGYGDITTITLPNGTYEICMFIEDSATSCYDNTCQTIVVNDSTQNCVASFTYTDDGNGTFSFTNTSGSGLDYYWNFDNLYGFPYATSSIENPTYAYSAPGTYYVSLSIYDSINSCYDSIAQQIVFQDPCNIVAGFTFVDNGNGDYTFTNTSTGTNQNSYQWSFGDGGFSYIENPLHTFTANGTYQVCITAGDSTNGCYDDVCQSITVIGVSNPSCNYTVEAQKQQTNNYTFFTNQSSGTIYTLDFGDGNTSSSSYQWGWNHTYSNSGTYYYCLTIDSCPPVCDSVVIDVCDYYISAYVDSLSVVHFSSNAPYPASYFWDFGDGNTSTSASPNYTYSAPGTYYYCLTVDSCPTVCDSIVVPSCNVYAWFNTYNFGNGNYSFYNGSGGSALNGLSFFWNFGDGNTSTTYDANHTYTTNGTYVVVLAAMDSTVYGTCMDYYTATITITDAGNPVTCNAAFVMYTDSSYNGVMVVNSSTGSNLSYFWDFGDGNTSTQAYPNYTYATAGPFELCLTVTGDSSCTSTYCDSIDAGGIVLKTNGFSINVVSPITVGIKNEIDLISALTLYPNPVKNNLTVELGLTEQTVVEIFVTDLLGNMVVQLVNEEASAGTNKFVWNTGNTKNGIYLLNIISNHSRQIKKVVVNR
ncbi:MAG: PKD domain-containing protein [Bacteroidetes bacterium]|nr:PKD domain-containing protein [Bacteroidota bacterium]